MCPSEEDLRCYRDEELGETDRAAIDAHLQGCPRCLEALQAMVDADAGEIADALLRGPLIPPRPRSPAPDSAADPARVDFPGAGAAPKDAPRPIAEGPGSRIGPYKLLQKVGEGGMGVVYMAERVTPFQQMVALKVIKAGMDSRQVLARFNAERQALALMDHPHIAKVLDAGATEHGRPYFVMELVKGIPITRYCDERRLTLRERLELFIPVCQAVQHAHQKGIIHRDLKPSNVLIGVYDGKPVPKVIDFGVAKATGQRLTEMTLFTGFGAVIGTPEYMSPEQAQLDNLDIDTRSDVYALGVLLYELLTGTTPLDRKRLKEVAILKILQIIREEEPPRPSVRLSSTDTLPSLAACRQTEPARLTELVRGDLDWIVMTALQKERNQRYGTVSEFAIDVQRYLAGEPVVAAPPSWSYRLRKFARKYRAALTTASLFAALLVVGVLVSTVLAVRARRAESATKQALTRVQEEQEKTKAALDAEQESALKAQANALKAQASEREANANAARVRAEEQRANLAQKDAESRRDQALRALHEKQMLSWRLALDRGLSLCERDEIQQGLLWLARSLEVAPTDEVGLRRSTLMILDGWRRQILPLRARFEHPHDWISAVAFSPNGNTVLTGATSTARLWDAATGRLIGAPMVHQGIVRAAAFSPDGKVVLTGCGGYSPEGPDRGGEEARLWDAATGKPIGAPMAHRGPVFTVAFSPDGRTCLTGSGDKTARLWDVATGKPIGAPMAHRGEVTAAAFSPDGKAILTGSREDIPSASTRPVGDERGEARLWDAATGKPLAPPITHRGGVRRVAFSPDGSRFLTMTANETHLWDAATGKRLGDPIEHNGALVGPTVFSPDGKAVLIGTAASARLWDAATGKPLAPPIMHRAPIRVAAFRFDGKAFLTGTGIPGPGQTGGEARLWEAATGEPLTPPITHRGAIVVAAFSPDGRVCLTGGEFAPGPGGLTFAPGPLAPRFAPRPTMMGRRGTDGEVRLWDAATGKPIGAPMAHRGPVFTAAFSPDGRTCLTASGDGMVRLWPVPTPPADDAERIALWIQLMTGMQLDKYDNPTYLKFADREKKLKRLKDLGGAPFHP
jgi:WD40 repeat protein/serine/threonine protein kinase